MAHTTLIVIGAITQTTLHIEFVARVHVALHYLSQLAVEHQVVPV